MPARKRNVARVRVALAAILMVLVIFAASGPARAGLSGDMQGAIADMVNNAIAAEDAKGLGAAINDLCASHPDIKEEIVAAFAAELASKRPPGFCAGKGGPCLDLDSVMDTLLSNILITYDTSSGGESVARPNKVAARDNTGECGDGDCSLKVADSESVDRKVVEPPPSSSPSPVDW